MTPEQKLKWAVLQVIASWEKTEPAIVNAKNIDEVYDLSDDDYKQDARNEIRCSGTKTGLPCQDSRNYESDAVAAMMPDGSWVGWTYWYGGGKHGQPEAIDWMGEAYAVNCAEEQKMVTVRTFTMPVTA